MPNSYPKDVFMHILTIIALYVGTFGLLALFFQYVNFYFPDPLNPNYDVGGAIRWALASLIIIFPVFLWASLYLYKDRAQNPAKGELKIRKWLLYFTLFAAGVLVIGDLVALLYNFLEGELTVRFFLKALSILIVASAIFMHYLYDLRRAAGEFSAGTKVFVWSVCVVVAFVIVWGFFIAGSPFKQRLVRFDEQKVSALQSIQWTIVNYWQQKGKLPKSLGELTDNISGFVAPRDPQTDEDYIYRSTGELSFEFCANFNLPSWEPKRLAYPLGIEENWDHDAGDVCFSRTIDPELYSSYPKR